MGVLKLHFFRKLRGGLKLCGIFENYGGYKTAFFRKLGFFINVGFF